MFRIIAVLCLSFFVMFSAGKRVHEMEVPLFKDVTWKNCDGTLPVTVKSLSLGTDTIKFGSSLTVSANVQVQEELKQGLSGAVDLKMKQGAEYVNICDLIGKQLCQLPDVCGVVKKLAPVCPDSLRQKGFNCTCPVPQNDYSVQQMQIKVPDLHFGIAGTFKATFHVRQEGKEVACLEIDFCLEHC